MRRAFLLATIFGLVGASASAQKTPAPCCDIVSIDARAQTVTAKVTATGTVFKFQVASSRALAALKVGQGVFANFPAGQVSLDGRSACCTITSGPAAAAASTPAPRAPAVAAPAPTPPSAGRTAPQNQPAPPAVTNAPVAAAIVNTLPTISYGPPQPAQAVGPRALTRVTSQAVTAKVAGRTVTRNVLHLRGLKAVSEAPGLPDGARRILELLVRKTPRTESDHYIVDVQLAQEWIAAHPVPPEVKATEPKEEDKDCNNFYDSFDCAGQAISDEYERAFDHATNEWENAEETLADAWDASVACFTEKTLTLSEIPVRFSLPNSMTINLAQSGSRGSGTGTVKGSVGLGLPMEADFDARLDLFYIPCLPFAVRPKSLSAEGVMTVAQELTVDVSATGRFNKTFTIPPGGGPVIPIQVFPIMIGNVPVAVLDVSAYIEGNIEVTTEGAAEGSFSVRNSDQTRFDFSCNGGGCNNLDPKGASSPTTVNESAQIEGTVTVKPAVYTALQLNFNYEALSARAGPQPYLLGSATGCAAVAGSQTAGGGSTAEENHALTADLDWGVELRAEALMMGKIIGEPLIIGLMDDKHLWFRDLAPGGSNALVAVAESTGQAMATKPARYRLRMPSCYPFPDKVEYQVSWTGNATPAPKSGCDWKAGGGTCKAAPASDLLIDLTWPAEGNYTVTVVPVGDGHDRVFNPAPPPTLLSVSVVPSDGSGAPAPANPVRTRPTGGRPR